MSTREEFEKAFKELDCNGELGLDHATALWAAKWMGERCVNLIEESQPEPPCRTQCADQIRELLKGLDT